MADHEEEGEVQQQPLTPQKLYGRQAELATLKSVLTENNDNNAVRCVFVAGASGSGKSALLQQSVIDCSSNNNSLPLLCGGRGKFEQQAEHSHQAPFAALSHSLIGFANYLQQNDQVLQPLRQTLDSDVQSTLCRFCPALRTVFFEEDTASESSAGSASTAFDELNGISDHATTGFARLQNCVRAFIRALLSNISPTNVVVVWMVEDLQWMDDQSLALLRSVLEDRQLNNKNTTIENKARLVFLASYRTNEAFASDEVEKWIQSTRATPTTYSATHIYLDDLPLETVQQLLLDRFGNNSNNGDGDNNLTELADILHNRTQGRAFLVVQMMDYLQSQSLLYYDSSMVRWQVRLNQIKRDSVILNMEPQQRVNNNNNSELEIVRSRLERLPDQVQHLLQVAALLGSLFEKRSLLVALYATTKAHDNTNEAQPTINSSPEEAFAMATNEQHLIVPAASNEVGMFRFAHDKIYEVALDMVHANSGRADELRWIVATALWNQWQDASSWLSKRTDKMKAIADRILFVCVELFNASSQTFLLAPDTTTAGRAPTNGGETFEVEQLLQLNYEAGQRCSRMNAYVPAKQYFTNAIDLLQHHVGGDNRNDPWESHHFLMIKLHCVLAEVCLCCGQFDAIPDIANVALSNVTREHEAFRIQYVCLQRLLMTNQIEQLVGEALDLLNYLGEKFTKDVEKKAVSKRRKEVLAVLGSLTNDQILDLPTLTDKKKRAALQVMINVLAAVQYFSRYQDLTRILQLRMIELTLQSGISTFAPNCFGFGAFALFNEQNKEQFEAAIRCADLAVAIAKKQGGKRWFTCIAPDSLTFRHWTKPYAHDLDDAMAIYQEDLKAGRLLTAFQAAAMYLYCYYFSGLDLSPLAADADTMCQIKMEYGQTLRLLHMLPIYQLVLNLTGQNHDILDMYRGKAMDYREKLGWGTKSRDGEEAQWSYSLHLYVYCEAWDLAYDMYDKMIDKDIGVLRSFPIWHHRVFFFALIAIHRARGAPWMKRGKIKREAEKHVALIHLWVSKRKAINLLSKYLILRAELLTIQRKVPSDSVLTAAYDKAIQLSLRSGYPQDAALAAASAARAVRDTTLQVHYALHAQDSYTQWGAHGVVQHLCATSDIHKRAAETNLDQKDSIRFRSRRRFDSSITEVHKEYSLGSSEMLSSLELSSDFVDGISEDLDSTSLVPSWDD